jgi:hypothetical protein
MGSHKKSAWGFVADAYDTRVNLVNGRNHLSDMLCA